MLWYDVKRALSVRYYLLGVIIMLLTICIDGLDILADIIRRNVFLECGWSVQFVEHMLLGDMMTFALPIVCTLPFSSSFIDEYKCGQIWYVLGRISKKRYIYSKAITTAISGGSVLFAGSFLSFFIYRMLFYSIEKNNLVGTGVLVFGEMFEMIWKLSVRNFAYGALCAGLGLTIATALNNRYMAWIGPFMIQYLLIILCERYKCDIVILYPREWINPSLIWPFEQWSVPLWLFFLTFFVLWIFLLIAERKISDANKI